MVWQSQKQYLDSFLNSEKISVLNTLWVLGIEVDEPIILDDGYAIKPITEMPDSREKEYFLQNQLETYHALEASSQMCDYEVLPNTENI